MADQLVALDVDALVGQELELCLGGLAVVQTEVVTCLQVHTDGTLRVGLQVHG